MVDNTSDFFKSLAVSVFRDSECQSDHKWHFFENTFKYIILIRVCFENIFCTSFSKFPVNAGVYSIFMLNEGF
jgi:hypothetical protein